MHRLTLAFTLAGLAAIGRAQTTAKHSSGPSKTRTVQSVSNPASDAAAGAQAGLQMLKKSITRDNYKQFGFDSLDEVSRAELGDGVPLFYVKADQLKDYAPGTDTGRLMIPTQRRLYPVIVDGVGKLVMTIESANNQWKLVDFGQQDIASSLSKIKHDKISRSKGPAGSPQNYFAVQIRSMHLNFLAYSPPAGPGGPSVTKRQVTFLPLDSADSMRHSIGFKNSDFLVSNPQFNSASEGAKSANEVLAAVAPRASEAMKTDAPR